MLGGGLGGCHLRCATPWSLPGPDVSGRRCRSRAGPGPAFPPCPRGPCGARAWGAARGLCSGARGARSMGVAPLQCGAQPHPSGLPPGIVLGTGSVRGGGEALGRGCRGAQRGAEGKEPQLRGQERQSRSWAARRGSEGKREPRDSPCWRGRVGEEMTRLPSCCKRSFGSFKLHGASPSEPHSPPSLPRPRGAGGFYSTGRVFFFSLWG